jgi:gentisate 1,2-dioxygenase
MPNDVEFKTGHELLEAAMRLPPLKIPVVDATAKHVIEGAASAAIKGIRSPISGHADLLLVPTWNT